MKREANEAAAAELMGLIEARKAIENAIEAIKQAYVGTWDDDEAVALRVEWRKLRNQLYKAEDEIAAFYDSFK